MTLKNTPFYLWRILTQILPDGEGIVEIRGENDAGHVDFVVQKFWKNPCFLYNSGGGWGREGEGASEIKISPHHQI